MLTINEILPLNNITRRQLNNRLKLLQLKYPIYLNGGGRGRGGRYSVHPILLDLITKPNKDGITTEKDKEIFKNSTDAIKKRNLYTSKTFESIDWKYFVTISPFENIEEKRLIETIPLALGDTCFYSIHHKTTSVVDGCHIHFVIKTNKAKKDLEGLKSDFRMNIKVDEYDPQKTNCFQYLTSRNLFGGTQQQGEFGFKLGA